MSQMIIANRLVDGVVVFFDASHAWVESIGAGTVIDDAADAERLMAVAKADEKDCVVIDPYLIDVEIDDDGRRPTSIRESIRAFGPSVRTDLSDAS